MIGNPVVVSMKILLVYLSKLVDFISLVNKVGKMRFPEFATTVGAYEKRLQAGF
jgi:hypothetical protein